MTCFDSICEVNADDECRQWIRQLIDAKDEIVAFVDARLDGQGTGEYLGAMKGSFNLSFHIGFGPNRPSVLIRFPKPGHTKSEWRAEKVMNEVRVIEYLQEHTMIPVPNVRFWGSGEESPCGLGPFIVMDFIEGTRLSSFLREPTDDEAAEMILNTAIDEAILEPFMSRSRISHCKCLDSIFRALAPFPGMNIRRTGLLVEGPSLTI